MSQREIKPIDGDPRYQEASEKLAGVQQRLKSIERRINEFNLALPSASRKTALETQARDYLESNELPTAAIGPSSPELEKLHLERRIARKAEELASRDLDKVRDMISREVSREFESRHRELVQAQAVLVDQLIKAAKDYRDFRDEFAAKGIACLLPVGTFPFLGFSLEESGGMGGVWIKQMKTAGLIR